MPTLNWIFRTYRRVVKHVGRAAGVLTGCALLAGCEPWWVEQADREVYAVIDQRQREALGLTADARIQTPELPVPARRANYSFVPSPLDPAVPAGFAGSPGASQPADVPAAAGDAASMPVDVAAFWAAQESAAARRMTFDEVMVYAFAKARDIQTEKERLYRAALALTLERFLWTPQLVAEVRSQWVNYGQARDFDNAMDAIAELAATQRLPLGGQVTAQVLSTWIRDLGQSITAEESGQAILGADIPLLRGAGRVAYESRYQAERDLIYAVRDYERFRRAFFVDVASDYLDLLVSRQAIVNAEFAVKSFEDDAVRARALGDAGRIDALDVQRADQELLVSRQTLVNSITNYQTLLDAFKVRIGMPVPELLVLVEEELKIGEPVVTEEQAIGTALHSRLDLINTRDRIGDAERGVRVASNQLLPDWNVGGTVRWDTEPLETNIGAYEDEIAEWRVQSTVSLPVNRQFERNQFRSSLIDLQAARRGYDLQADQVRQQVREAVRRIEQALVSIRIQEVNIKLAEDRREAAAVKFELGRVGNRDKVEAENALLDARNTYARALGQYQQAILAFRRDTDTLRLDHDGKMIEMTGG